MFNCECLTFNDKESNSKFKIYHSKLLYDFGYKPDTKLADGIGEFVKWYKIFYGENK